MRLQPAHPIELVAVLGGIVGGIAVRQVEAADPDAFHGCLHITGLLVGVIAGQALLHIGQAEFGQQSDAVIGALPDNGAFEADVLEDIGRKGIRLALGLLQAQNVRMTGLQPVADRVGALLDRVDVPGGDAHQQRLSDWAASGRRRDARMASRLRRLRILRHPGRRSGRNPHPLHRDRGLPVRSPPSVPDRHSGSRPS